MKQFVLLAVILTLSSCVVMSPPKSSPENGKSLIIGQVIYEGTGQIDRAVNMNGISKSGIKVEIQRKYRDENPIEVVTNKEGLFYFLGNANHSYFITYFYLKRNGSNGGSWSSVGKGVTFQFKSAPSGVTNVGSFKWVETKHNASVQREFKYQELKTFFTDTFQDSVWVREKWTNG